MDYVSRNMHINGIPINGNCPIMEHLVTGIAAFFFNKNEQENQT